MRAFVFRFPFLLPTIILFAPLPGAAVQAGGTDKPSVGAALEKGRETLASYQWRLKTEIFVDDVPRMTKLEDVHLGPEGTVVRKTIRFEKKPPPTPVPYRDPRASQARPATDEEDERFADQATGLMLLYAQLSPERFDEWAMGAAVMTNDADHPGQIPMHGHGLGRPQDDTVLYLDARTKRPRQIEVKTTVEPEIKDIAFLRATFEPLPAARPGVEPLVVPKKIFLNMDRGRHRVRLEMETFDYRAWP